MHRPGAPTIDYIGIVSSTAVLYVDVRPPALSGDSGERHALCWEEPAESHGAGWLAMAWLCRPKVLEAMSPLKLPAPLILLRPHSNHGLRSRRHPRRRPYRRQT